MPSATSLSIVIFDRSSSLRLPVEPDICFVSDSDPLDEPLLSVLPLLPELLLLPFPLVSEVPLLSAPFSSLMIVAPPNGEDEPFPLLLLSLFPVVLVLSP